MIFIIEFNIIITFKIVSQNKYTHIITSFTCCVAGMIFQMYYRVFPQLESQRHMSFIHKFHNL